MKKFSRGSPPPNSRQVSLMIGALDDADIKVKDGEARYVGIRGKIKAKHVPNYILHEGHTGQKQAVKGESGLWVVHTKKETREFCEWLGRPVPVELNKKERTPSASDLRLEYAVSRGIDCLA